MNESVRAWLYRAALAAIVILTAYGFISDEEGEMWLLVVNTLLGLGTSVLASANTSTSSTQP